VDPVEKKPLFHFLPGTDVFSIATVGCNLRCDFCQNWEISQAAPEDVAPYDLEPEAVVEYALEYGCRSIAYTYTEPVVYYEYALDCARLARENGISNILVTAGYINPGPLAELASHVDAANVDLKSMSDRYYREVCGGTLQPVLDTILALRDRGVWVEVTNLVVPALNDGDEDIENLSRWVLENAGPDTPLHFSRFFPMYRLADLAPTPVDTLASARERAMDMGLNFVYVGNAVTTDGMVTRCPSCDHVLIERQGYQVEVTGMSGGLCDGCGAAVPGVWDVTEDQL
jgi:pyruvate formate lyase activating enzyme